jgi:hypothetical protein
MHLTGRYGSVGGCKLEIVRAVRNQPVPKAMFDQIVLQQEGARHALYVTCGKARKIAVHPGHQQAIDAFTVEILPPLGPRQPEGLIKLSVRIGKTRQIVQFVGSKKLRGACFGTKMHKGQTGSFGFNLGTKSGQLGDRLAAKGSTKMAQENEQQRMVSRKACDGFSALRMIGSQELRINVLCLEHRELIFTDSRCGGNRFRGSAWTQQHTSRGFDSARSS